MFEVYRLSAEEQEEVCCHLQALVSSLSLPLCTLLPWATSLGNESPLQCQIDTDREKFA